MLNRILPAFKHLGLTGALSCLALSLTMAAQAEQRCEPAAPTSDTQLSAQSNGTVIDTTRDLQWKRCSEGQAWSETGLTCTGQAERHNWPRALELAATARFGGHDDWRLPSLEELKGLVVAHCTDPAIDLTLFPQTPSYAFWSATPFEYFDRLAWAVYFNSGETGYSPRDYGLFHVRLVRDLSRS